MLKSQYPIKEGSLEFFVDHIEIRDKWKSARFQYNIVPYRLVAYPLEIVFIQKFHDEIWWIFMVLLIIYAITII